MEKYNDFVEKILNKIKDIDKEYKKLKEYVPNQKEQLLKEFLEDIWTPRFEKESLNKILDKAEIQLLFISRSYKLNVFSKNFKISKMNPKRKVTPLWYLISKLAEDNKEYDFYLSPNIFLKTKNYANTEKNIVASNVFFLDIDTVKTEKPIYNCSEDEIHDYLEKTYPFLKDCGYSYVTMSGRGLHVFFTLQYTSYLYSTKHKNYRRMEHRKLTEDLIRVTGADAACKNLNRVLRVPFSINGKMNIRTRFYTKEENQKKYSKEMIQSFLPIDETKKITKKEPVLYKNYEKQQRYMEKRKLMEHTEHEENENHNRGVQGKRTLYLNRKSDLDKFYEKHRDLKGRRHNFFLIYKMALDQLGYSEENLEKRLTYLNDGLVEPLTEGELQRILSEEKRYLFRNQTVADLLNFTQSEIASFKCNYSEEDIKQHIQDKNDYFHHIEKKDREEKRKEKEDYIFKIIEANKDVSMSRLAELLDCSKSTAWRWYQKYIKKG